MRKVILFQQSLVSDKPVDIKPLIAEGKDMHVFHFQFVLTWVFRPMTVVLIVFRCIWWRG
jgi:hypothetical protein